MAAKRGPKRQGLPSREQILDFVNTADGKVGKREIARAFDVSGADRVGLKQLLRDMADEGLIARGHRRRISSPGSLPPVALAEVTGIDLDGDPIARPTEWHGEGAPPSITVLPPDRRGVRPPGPGDRVLLRLSKLDDRHYEGRIIKVLAERPGRIVGVYRRVNDGRDGGRLQPAERRVRSEFLIFDDDAANATPGDLVIAESLPSRRLGLRQARVIRVLESVDSPRAISQLVLNAHDIPVDFPTDALSQADRAKPPALGKRIDLRDLPLVTIDDEDARDFDDAVWAEPDPDNPDGWHLIVAIADVAHYVRPGDAIDQEAKRRGNSVYLPDMVVPMLPEALSNGLCSLRPNEDRACLVAHLWIDRDGALLRHRFERALMRSAARLTYRGVQAAIDGARDGDSGVLFDNVIAPLVGAYQSLRRGRDARGTLDFDLPERRVLFGADGHVSGLEPRPRFDSHRIIEEFMITANVAAAKALTTKHAPCMFRIHDQPSLDKLEGLREYLASLGYKLSRSRHVTPGHFNHILKKAEDTPEQETVAMMVLRSQAQAEYSPHNIGHFGLSLPLYAHFTSPIRRYADLLVHRSLIAAHRLGAGGLAADDDATFEEIGAQISATERRAATAERDAADRFATRFLSERVGAKFTATITGVTRFGLFVRLADTGAEGLIPMRDFGEYMRHDENRHRLVGESSGAVHSLGGTVEVTLIEADTVTGSLRFELEGVEETRSVQPKSGRRRRRTRR